MVHDLVEELPRLLGLRYAALYLRRGDRLERVAGPDELPAALPQVPGFSHQVRSYASSRAHRGPGGGARVEPGGARAGDGSAAAGSARSWATSPLRGAASACVLLSGRAGQLPLEQEELRLLRGLLQQAAIALETSQLLDERARQAELERELEIAAAIQASLLPAGVRLGDGWEVAAACRPARHVGGDFFAELPGPDGNGSALIYGDVSGKSVPGALMMMAAKEALHSLALVHRDPEELIHLANRRLHELGNRSFVALGYLACGADGDGLSYLLAGQPPPLKRRRDGAVEAVPLPDHRLPLGAMLRGRHRLLSVPVEPGEVLLAYSDGVVEAHSPAGEMFGEERLMTVLASAPPEPTQVLSLVLSALELFTRGEEAYDDVTLLAVGRPALEAN